MTTIGNLPLKLRERIVKNITPISRSPNARPTLDHRENYFKVLPSELLAPAQSSPAILTAVVSVLGPSVCYITGSGAEAKLDDWIRMLAPHVHAVSLYNPLLSRLVGSGYESDESQSWKDASNTLLSEGLAVLEAVVEPPVALRVLDLGFCPMFLNNPIKDKLYNALVTALRHNGTTLCELALPVSIDCARALEKVSLPVLEVAEFSPCPYEYRESKRGEEPWVCNEARMIRALQRSVGSRKGVREIRLRNVRRIAPQGMEADGLLPEFLCNVKVLDVTASSNLFLDGKRDMVTLCALFPELRRLRWNVYLDREEMQRLVAVCPLLEEIYIMRSKQYVDLNQDLAIRVDELPRVFEAARSKLRSITLIGHIPAIDIHALGATSPNLEVLELGLRLNNISALAHLLASQCRKIQSLRLLCEEEYTTKEDAIMEWRSLTAAVSGASDALHEVEVTNKNYSSSTVAYMQGMMNATCEILKILANRAEKVVFNFGYWTPSDSQPFKVAGKVLKEAAKWCGNLEQLTVIVSKNVSFDSAEQMCLECIGLLKAREQLRRSARRLHFLDLGGLAVAAETSFSSKRINMDSTKSRLQRKERYEECRVNLY